MKQPTDPTFLSRVSENIEFDLSETTPTQGEIQEIEEAPISPEEMAETSPSMAAAPSIPGLPYNYFPGYPYRYLYRKVSGRYQGTSGNWQLELRVDVDRTRPMNMVSADFFHTSGATTSYFGSFIVDDATVTTTTKSVTIEGRGDFTFGASYPRVKLTIPRVSLFSYHGNADATLQFLSESGSPGASYNCPFVSSYFRNVQWEQDYVSGTVPFESYDTGSLPGPAGSRRRTLTVPASYREAGVDLQSAGIVNEIDTSSAGTDLRWNDTELHAAMVNNFSMWADVPQWKVWLLVATRHYSGYRGIMFDYSGTYQRQGCAVFYNAIQGTSHDRQRAALRTYVHELGHCFNLLHSWQKNLADPPAPLGPNGGYGDLSWMNYTHYYQPGGTNAYWANFDFQFTDNEVIHLRHAFYRNIVLGGNAFGTGAAEVDPELFSDRIEDHSGLRLELKLQRPSFALGEPVVVEVKLSCTDTRGKRVHSYLHPKDGFVEIAIRQPSRRIQRYRSIIEHCVDDRVTMVLDGNKPSIYESAYIGYGKDGFYFDQPGTYQLRAFYSALDGSKVVSPMVSLRVRAPVTAAESNIADLFFGDEQGQLLYFLGSDLDSLQSGKDAFDEVLDRYPRQPLSVYARLVKGINAERDFKLIQPDKKVKIREADPSSSVENLKTVVESSTTDKGIDNITLNMATRTLASAQVKAGDMEQASETLDGMVNIFRRKKLNPIVLEQINAEVAEEKKILGL